MHVTIASPEGGYNRECTPEEAEKIEKEWAKNAAESAIEKKAQAEEDRLADEGMNDLVKTLPPAQAAALKKKLNV